MEESLSISLQNYLIPAITGLILLEFILLWCTGRRHFFNWKESLSSVVIGIVYFLITNGAVTLVWFGLQIYLYEHFRLFTLDFQMAWVWLLLLLGEDFSYYWMHRLEHEVRLFWCTHMTHHTPEKMNFSTAVRMPPGEALYHPLARLWMPLMGFHPLMYPILGAFNLIMGLLQHTELVGRLGFLEEILATPSHHRVHHGSNDLYIDKNYGARFIIWDRIFGTFQRETEAPAYGLTRSLNTQNPLRLVFSGYTELLKDVRYASSVQEGIQIAFRRPSASVPGEPEMQRNTI